MSKASIRQALVVLCALYQFLVAQGIAERNPWTGLSKPRTNPTVFDASRSLTHMQWQAVRTVMDELVGATPMAASPRRRQLRWAVELLQSSGLRLAEIVGARTGDLRWFQMDEIPETAGVGASKVNGWCVEVQGKGDRRRRVPVPSALAMQFADLELIGRSDAGADRALVVRWKRDAAGRWHAAGPLGAHGLYLQIRQLMRQVSQSLRLRGRIEDADALEHVTTHWLRHTFATHAVASGVPLDVVGGSLGHRSLSTTSRYVTPELARRLRMTQARFFRPDESREASIAAPGHTR